MPEEALETQDVQEMKEKLEESSDGRGEDGGGERNANAWTVWLSLSTAVIAVLAAIASLEAGANANDAIVRKDDAILHQAKANGRPDDEPPRHGRGRRAESDRARAGSPGGGPGRLRRPRRGHRGPSGDDPGGVRGGELHPLREGDD